MGISSYASSKLAVIKLGQTLSLGTSSLSTPMPCDPMLTNPEYPVLRVFSLHPGIVDAADRGMVVDAFTPFAKDTQGLTGGVSLWLDTPKADFLKGGFISANWDVNEMEAHKSEIADGKLTELAFLKAQLGPEGHPWESK